MNSHVQYIWGALYIDDIVLRRLDANADGDFEDVGDKYWYHLTDPQFSTVAILNGSATVVERVTYDAFGEARHHPYKDVDGDGDYDSTDYNTISNISVGLNNKIGESNYRSEADLDRDGDVDSTDVTLAGTSYVAALAKGDLSDPAVDNIVGWSGGEDGIGMVFRDTRRTQRARSDAGRRVDDPPYGRRATVNRQTFSRSSRDRGT